MTVAAVMHSISLSRHRDRATRRAPSPRSPADAQGNPAEHAPRHLPAVTTTIRNACDAYTPGGFPTGRYLDAVQYPASAHPEPVAPGEADAHGSTHDVSAS
jgi:hypothetical protein